MSLSPGSRLDAYEIVRPLGSGGMGEVWLATEVRLGRKVALKLLPSDLTRDPMRVQRFEQEARAASALNHPNVCTIHALGQTSDGQYYIAMEYVEGETLRQRLATTRLSIREALEVAIQVAAALSAAHAAGIVHRDIKPENVMLRPDGFVKVLDFGLAKLAPTAPEVAGADTTRTVLKTEAGVVVGTAAYMSPEQACGQEVDARTDIWSLGVVLYEMVAGRSPFAAPSGTEVLAAILDREPGPLARFEPEAPAELQRIVTKTLRKDRAQRYQTVHDLLLDLRALRDEAPTRAGSGTELIGTHPRTGADDVSGQAPAPVRVRQRVMLAVAAAALLAAVASASWWSKTTRLRQSSDDGGTAPGHRPLTRLTFGRGLQMDVTLSPDGRSVAYASDRAGNFDIWVQPAAGGEPVQVTRSPAHELQPDWSPDSRLLAFRSEANGGGIQLVPALGGAERRLADGGYRPRFSPDGRQVLYLSSLEHETTNIIRPDVYVAAVEGGAPRRLFAGFWDQVIWFHNIDWHPDGKRVSFTASHRQSPGEFFTVELPDGLPVASRISSDVAQRLEWDESRAAASTRVLLREFRWHPSGRRLFFSGLANGLKNIWSIDVDPATLEWKSGPLRVTAGAGSDGRPALSADGRRLAFTVSNELTRVWVMPLNARQEVTSRGEPVSPDDLVLRSFDLARTGSKLVFAGWLPGGGRTQLWELLLETGERSLRLSDQTDRIFLKYSRSAEAVALLVTENQRMTLRVLGGAVDGERTVTDAQVYPSDWTPDDTAIIASTTDGPGRPWFIAAWQVPAAPNAKNPFTMLLRDPVLSLWGARYSPDGKWFCFNAHGEEGKSLIGVAPVSGPVNRPWLRVTDGQQWDDKPRWSPDGRYVFFIRQSESGVFNLYRVRLDAGRSIGEPVRVTSFDSPSRTISPDLGTGEIAVGPDRVAASVREATGSIWMLDNVDK